MHLAYKMASEAVHLVLQALQLCLRLGCFLLVILRLARDLLQLGEQGCHAAQRRVTAVALMAVVWWPVCAELILVSARQRAPEPANPDTGSDNTEGLIGESR